MTIPRRNLTFKISARGKQDQMSYKPAVLVVSNPQPELPTSFSISSAFNAIFINYKAPSDLDWAGMLVWMSTESGFVPSDSNKEYEGSETSIHIGNLAPDTEYFIVLAPFDAFGKTDLNVSSEFSVTTGQIIENQIEDFAVTNAKIKNLDASKIISGIITASEIFLGNDIRLNGEDSVVSVYDRQDTPQLRFRYGKLGDQLTDYGFEVYDSKGNKIIGADGLGTEIVGPLQLSKVAREGLFTTGDIKSSFKNVPDAGWVLLRGGTIGNADSLASERANADTWDLFEFFWLNLLDVDAPVSEGRGANAAEDFNLNKQLTVPDFRGRGSVGAGQGSSLTNRVLGSRFGSETHKLTEAQLPAVSKSFTDTNTTYSFGWHSNPQGGSGNGPSYIKSVSASGGSSTKSISFGSGATHPIMQPSIGVNFMVKL